MDNSAGGDIDEVARESTAVAVNWTGQPLQPFW